MDEKKKIKIMNLTLDMPDRKIIYVIGHRALVAGLWGHLNAFGLPYTKENHELLVEVVQTRLEGPDLEREWSEPEYTNFVQWEPEDETTTT